MHNYCPGVLHHSPGEEGTLKLFSRFEPGGERKLDESKKYSAEGDLVDQRSLSEPEGGNKNTWKGGGETAP